MAKREKETPTIRYTPPLPRSTPLYVASTPPPYPFWTNAIILSVLFLHTELHHSTANLILSTTRDLRSLRLPDCGATIHSFTSTVLSPPSYHYYYQTPPSRTLLDLQPSLPAKMPAILSALKSAVFFVATLFSVANILAVFANTTKVLTSTVDVLVVVKTVLGNIKEILVLVKDILILIKEIRGI
ncbi:unnamed protein product [Penicillium salamii]|nr:unnamed protein product [Penicillium salamii]